MQLFSVDTGKFKLDGGAMFGVVPKGIWNKLNPADENNLCTWALRCLLVIEGDRKILIDTGMGDKQDAKFFSHYHPHETVTLKDALHKINISPNDITDVLLTHLHFDHVGGAVYKEDNDFKLSFPNATYWVSEPQWELALNPNKREKASFLKENIAPIKESGQLKFIEKKGDYTKDVFDNFDVLFVDGHTESMMIPHIKYKNKTLVFMADLLPSVGHIPLPYVMGYDTRPLITLKEKGIFLNQAMNEKYVLFLEHDAVNECCTLKDTEKGVRLDESFDFKSMF